MGINIKTISYKFINFFCSIGFLFLQVVPVKASDFDLQEITNGIYVHHGKQVKFDHPDHDDIANIGFIVGDNCVAVIDTGGSINIAQKLYDHIKEITSKPVCYVINTHVHFDHVLGNSVFKNPGTKFIGHRNLSDALLNSKAFFLKEYANELGGKPDDSSIVMPDITVDNTLEIDLGNRQLLLSAYPPAHSHTDLTILDKKTNTLWLSDILFIDRIPALDGSLRGWLAVMKKIESLNPTYVIPGHGPTNLNLADAIEPQKVYLTQLLNETRSMIENGHFMEEAIEQVEREEKLKWLLYEQHHKRNVSKAFTELEWE